MPEGSHERTAHPFPIGEAGLSRDLVHRQRTLLHHQPRRLDSQLFDGFGGRSSRLGEEHAAELPRAEASGIRKLLHS